jgi:hypothetical protein
MLHLNPIKITEDVLKEYIYTYLIPFWKQCKFKLKNLVLCKAYKWLFLFCCQ